MSVYSASLLVVGNGTPAGGPYESEAVGSGFVTVLRDISGLINAGTPGAVLIGLLDPSSNLYYVYSFVGSASSPTFPPFHWEGRIVLLEGWKLLFQVLDGTASVAMSGYNLSNY